MTIHLQRFVDRLRGAEARGLRDFTMSMTDAQDLHADITRLLLNLQQLREQAMQNSQDTESITVEIRGSSF